MTFDAYIKWLEEVPLYGHKDGIRNMQKLMACFGDPQDQIPVIHVAGTNGKGSCCAMLSQILKESGYKVGMYTSPHLVEYTERIQVDGRQISKEDWVSIGLEVKEAAQAIANAGGNHATFFELITAIGFLYFARQKVDVILLETGVGGRLDATNVVIKPELCVITSISLDHTKVLGNTLEQIAAEKAGIIQPGVPVVLAHNGSAVQKVVSEKAQEQKSPYCYSGEVQYHQPDHYSCGHFDYQDLKAALIGDYQVQNISAVLCAVDILQAQGWHISEETLRRGLINTRWPGRMEKCVFRGKPLLMDGAHNPSGAQRLADYLDHHYREGSCTLVMSALAKKDVTGILQPLCRCKAIGNAVFTCIDGENQLEYLSGLWQEKRINEKGKILCIEKPRRALETAALQEDTELVVCAGSLYLVGEIKAILMEEADV